MSNGVYKYLDVSTAHISESDDSLLTHNSPRCNLVNRPYEEGYWIYVPSDDEEFAELIKHLVDFGYSYGLISVMMKAHALQCMYVVLDCDGEEHEDLGVFDW